MQVLRNSLQIRCKSLTRSCKEFQNPRYEFRIIHYEFEIRSDFFQIFPIPFVMRLPILPLCDIKQGICDHKPSVRASALHIGYDSLSVSCAILAVRYASSIG
jgi:hypothetical protein